MRWLVALLVAGLVARLAALRFQPIVAVDGTTYIRLARALFGGAPIDTVQAPGYPFLIGLILRLGLGDEVRAAQVVNVLCGTLLLLPFFALARHTLRSRRAALLATAVLAMTPLAIRYSATTLSESSFLLCVLTASALLVGGRPTLAGLAGGAAALIRPEGFLFTGALAAESAWRGWRARRHPTPDTIEGGTAPPPLRVALRPALLVATGLLLAGVVPSLLYNHATSGQWTLSRKGINLAAADMRAREVDVARTLAGPPVAISVVERLGTHGGDISRYYPVAFSAQIRHLVDALGLPGVGLALLGVAGAPAALLPGLAQGFAVPAFPAVPAIPRLALPLLPFLLLLTLRGVERVDRRWPRTGRRIAGGLFGAGWLLAAALALPALRINEDGNYPELRDAGLALRPVVTPEALVFDRKPYAAFYAGARYQTIPTGDYSSALDAMAQVGGNYLVVAEAVAEVFRPELLPLARDAFTMVNDPRLLLVYLDGRRERRRVAIYRFVRPGDPPVTAAERAHARELVAGIPEDDTLAGLHADLLRRQGDLEGMCRQCERLLAVEPANWRAMVNLSLGLLTLDRDHRQAWLLTRHALRLAPGEAAALSAAAWADSICAARNIVVSEIRS